MSLIDFFLKSKKEEPTEREILVSRLTKAVLFHDNLAAMIKRFTFIDQQEIVKTQEVVQELSKLIEKISNKIRALPAKEQKYENEETKKLVFCREEAVKFINENKEKTHA